MSFFDFFCAFAIGVSTIRSLYIFMDYEKFAAGEYFYDLFITVLFVILLICKLNGV